MARLKVGTPEFDAAFKDVLSNVEEFTSRMPTHQQLQNAYLDPSLRVALGLNSAESILGRKSQDIQHGAQAIFFDMAADLNTSAGKLASFPSESLAGLKSVMHSSPIAGTLADADVMNIFSGEPSEAGKAIGNLALGVGLVAVGTAIPIVGQVGAALVWIGRSIYKVLQRQQDQLEKAKEEAREKLWESFPDLQSADSTTDAGQVQYGLRAILQTQDWTAVALPRFKGDWVGIERKKGFAFAPGKATAWSDNFGEDSQAFEPDVGLGLIPGTNILTSVIQVNLDPRGEAVQNFLRTGKHDPRGTAYPPQNPYNGARRVIDTGTFYECTRNMCILAWEQAQVKGSPLMYRFNVPLMHERWRQYCEGGIDYIKERVLPWWGKLGEYRHADKLGELNLEGMYGSAIFFAVGSWACYQTGGTNHNPTFTKYPQPSGYTPGEMVSGGMYPDSVFSGAFLPIKSGKYWANCMGNIYSRNPNIKGTLDAFAKVQRWCLKYTLVSAYVRATDAAFNDTDLLDLLRKMRAALLTSQARFAVNMLDVPEDEKHEGSDWRGLLAKSGVPLMPNKFQAGKGVKAAPVETSDAEPEPERPILTAGDLVPPAWDPLDQPPDKPSSRRWWPYYAGGMGLTLAAGWAYSNRTKLKKG